MLIRQFVLLACLSFPAFAQTIESLLPANPYAEVVYAAPAVRTISRTMRWQAEPITVNGQPFAQGFRVTVNGTSAKLSDAGLSWATTRNVRANDNLMLTFWVRKIAPLDNSNLRGLVTLSATNADAAEASLLTPFPCDSDVWVRYT
ncbi:MAG: hypothetical protein HOP19_18435, partial [Acidobacteria bacterium]|nr:hypothetical protein [Acidobacteriota bacterium]